MRKQQLRYGKSEFHLKKRETPLKLILYRLLSIKVIPIIFTLPVINPNEGKAALIYSCQVWEQTLMELLLRMATRKDAGGALTVLQARARAGRHAPRCRLSSRK